MDIVYDPGSDFYWFSTWFLFQGNEWVYKDDGSFSHSVRHDNQWGEIIMFQETAIYPYDFIIQLENIYMMDYESNKDDVKRKISRMIESGIDIDKITVIIFIDRK